MSVDVKQVFDRALEPFIGVKWYCCPLDFSQMQYEKPANSDKPYNYALVVVVPYDELMTLEDYEEQRQWDLCLRMYAEVDQIRQALTAACVANNIPLKIPRHSIDHMTPPYMVILSNKYVGVKSGAGWIGKNDLLITKEYGPRVWMQSAVFYAEHMECQKPATQGHCGDCQICVQTCPCKNLSGKEWQDGTPREDLVDYHRCSVYRFNLAKSQKLDHKYTCARCLLSCPRGQENIAKVAAAIQQAKQAASEGSEA